MLQYLKKKEEAWMGRKREGKFSFLFVKGNGKEMGRNLRVFPVWEGKGKEILNFFGMGVKWEENKKFLLRGKEKGRNFFGKVSEICQKRANKFVKI